jgi:PAS domain S-box-containing protein
MRNDPIVDIAAADAINALRVSNAKFSEIVSIASDAIISVDSSQTILNFNRGAEHIFGYSEEEVLGQPLTMLIPERFRAAHHAHVDRFQGSPVAARRMGERSTISGLRKNGEEFPAEASISRIEIDGQVILTAVLRDVTDQKRAIEALQVSEAKFSGIVSIASDAIISVDSAYNILNFNRGAEQIFKYSAADVVGRPLSILIPERFRTMHARHMGMFEASPLVARQMGERGEIFGLRSDGVEFPAEASISKLNTPYGRILTAVLRDVTDRKRAERVQQFLATAGVRLADSLDVQTTLDTVAQLPVPDLATACFVYTVDGHRNVRIGALVHADSARAETLSACLSGDHPAAGMGPLYSVLDAATTEIVSRFDATGEPAWDEHAAFLRSHGLKSGMIVPLIARGGVTGALGLFSAREDAFGGSDLLLVEDFARRAALALDNARLYREAREAVKARDDVLAVVSHDLGNSLSAIRIGTSLLLRNVPSEEQQLGGWQYIASIRESTAQMERLVNDLLDVKRMEAGMLSLHAETISVALVVEEVLRTLEPVAAAKPVQITVELAEPFPPIQADAQRLSQVFSNIIGNAIKYASPNGRVRVVGWNVDGSVYFEITDDGPGIPPDELTHIFDRFWRARGAGRVGSGLGLAISKGIVDAHGGRISAQSEVGSGTTLRIELPAPVSDTTS